MKTNTEGNYGLSIDVSPLPDSDKTYMVVTVVDLDNMFRETRECNSADFNQAVREMKGILVKRKELKQ